jgi:hypothetical protein
MRGKFDPGHLGIERNVVAYKSAPRYANSIAYGGDGELDKPVAFLHDDLDRFPIDHPLFSAKTNRRFPPVALPST